MNIDHIVSYTRPSHIHSPFLCNSVTRILNGEFIVIDSSWYVLVYCYLIIVYHLGSMCIVTNLIIKCNQIGLSYFEYFINA